MSIKRWAAAMAATTAFVAAGAATAQAALPVIYNFPTAIAASAVQPGGSPAGANDWSCRPSAAHPRPVVLVNGTFANQITSWNAVSPLLKNNGYCVYTFNYGGLFVGQIGSYGPIAASAGELKTEVDKVLASTGAAKVDLVGWSQGGMMPRYYLKNLGGAAKVNVLIGLAPSNHGTTLSGLATARSRWSARSARRAPTRSPDRRSSPT
jgi:triacylglycerol esterase/lipase EstA (alpha/beta hydrolase family)